MLARRFESESWGFTLNYRRQNINDFDIGISEIIPETHCEHVERSFGSRVG